MKVSRSLIKRLMLSTITNLTKNKDYSLKLRNYLNNKKEFIAEDWTNKVRKARVSQSRTKILSIIQEEFYKLKSKHE